MYENNYCATSSLYESRFGDDEYVWQLPFQTPGNPAAGLFDHCRAL